MKESSARHKLTTALLLIFFLPLHAQLQLDSCQVMARDNFPLLRQYDLINQAEQYSIENANKAYLPQLNVTLFAGLLDGLPDFGLQGNGTDNFQVISVVQLNQALWDGGFTKRKKELLRAESEVQIARTESDLYQLRKRVNALYFATLLLDLNLEETKVYKDQLQRRYTQLEVAVQNGIAFRTDLDEIKVEVLNLEEKETNLRYTRRAYYAMLCTLIGISAEPARALTVPEGLQLRKDGIENRPELRYFEEQRRLLEAQAELEKSALYPRVGLLGFGAFLNPGVNFGPSNLDRILAGGLQVSWNIGGLYRNKNNKRLRDLSLQQIDVQQEVFEFNTSLEMQQGAYELQKFEEVLLSVKEAAELKEKIRLAYEVKYDNGIATLNALMDKSSEAHAARLKQNLQEIQYLQKRYELGFIAGQN